MRAVGLPASSCYGPNNPVATCTDTWIQPGVVTVTPRGVEQHVMPKVLLTPMAVEAASVRRLCPRDSLAPRTSQH